MEFLETLDRCTALERAAGEVYTLLETRFADDAALRTLWHRMAADEREHAGELASRRAVVAREVGHPPIATGFTDAVREVEDLMQEARARASTCHTPEQAFAIALDLETSELDALSEQLQRSSEFCGGATTARRPGDGAHEHRTHHAALVRLVRERSHDDHNLLRAALLVVGDEDAASHPHGSR
jgi:hypothetical protein